MSAVEKPKTPEVPIVSHGRGGQGNIGPDSTPYVDAEIVREGVYGDQGDGAYSAGRGGAGNIGSPNVRPATNVPHDAEVVPELALRPSNDETYHTGRGGQGNVHLDKEAKEKDAKKKMAHKGLADKLKDKLMGRK
ncbi:uncharacterized protein N7515_008599 [Penicillium bovifimosum]|uniref:Uncharacterized protein n=1 Tax=Penicillium bovifimosum TaxID=126998 RepID=A0A9W9GNL3_9EURO|nr:uncharacterized protein N7515_008599 [Penicillium bovifimosum]KAJ5124774.1 hypothetical protein N7515_008599 [Penicillium bovifimosum]